VRKIRLRKTKRSSWGEERKGNVSLGQEGRPVTRQRLRGKKFSKKGSKTNRHRTYSENLLGDGWGGEIFSEGANNA